MRFFRENKTIQEEDGVEYTRAYITIPRTLVSEISRALCNAPYGWSTFVRWENGGGAARTYSAQRFPRAVTLVFNMPNNQAGKVYWKMSNNRFYDDKFYYQILKSKLYSLIQFRTWSNPTT